SSLTTTDYLDIMIWVAVLITLVWSVLQAWKVIGPYWDATPNTLRIGLGFIGLSLVFWQFYKRSTRDEAQAITAIVVLCLFNIFFWMGFEQAGGTMTFFAETQTDRELGGLVVAGIGLFATVAGYSLWRTTQELGGKALWLGLTLLFVSGGLALATFGAF